MDGLHRTMLQIGGGVIVSILATVAAAIAGS